MKKILYLSLSLFLVSACAENEQISDQNLEETSENNAIVIADKKLILDIDGMVCKMGCGGAIRKELKKTNAVSLVEFDFDEERTTNTAVVYFDSEQTNVANIVKLITTINDGQFTVGGTKTSDYEEVKTDEGIKNSESTDIQVDASESIIEIPNLLEVLSGLLIR